MIIFYLNPLFVCLGTRTYDVLRVLKSGGHLVAPKRFELLLYSISYYSLCQLG